MGATIYSCVRCTYLELQHLVVLWDEYWDQCVLCCNPPPQLLLLLLPTQVLCNQYYLSTTGAAFTHQQYPCRHCPPAMMECEGGLSWGWLACLWHHGGTNHTYSLYISKLDPICTTPLAIKLLNFGKWIIMLPPPLVSRHPNVCRRTSVPDFVYAIFLTVFHQWLSNFQIWWPWTSSWID